VIQTGPFGSQLHQSDYQPEGIPVIMPKDIADGQVLADSVARVSEETANRLARHKLKAGSIVLPRRGEIRKRAFIRPEQRGWLCGTGCLKIESLGKHVVPEFLYYFMDQSHVVQWLEQHAVGTTMLNLSAGIVAELPVRCPSIQSQRRIAGILSNYDDLIENNRRRMVLLEKAARLLYEEWFVRLRFPGHRHARIIDGLPEGWDRIMIGDYIERGIVELQTGPFGTQLRASDYVDSGTPLINVRNIGYGELQAEKLEFVPEAVVDRLGVHILQAGDIVFGRKGAVDRHLLINPAQAGWMQGSDCIRLRPVCDVVCPSFLSFAFRQENHKQWMLTHCSNKATMASVNQEVIGRIPVLAPSRELLHRFGDFASRILAQIASLGRKSQKAEAARDLLLPRLMSGKIAV
jgi:type I restriction enzyme S subunit